MTKLTNRKLIKWHREIEELKKEDSILPILLAGKIKEFNNQNIVRINTVKERMQEIIAKHRMCDENGNAYVAGEKAVMKEGHTWEDYSKEMNDYLDQEVNIIL